MDDKGRIFRNGKVMTDSAIEQRLRRFCTRRKSGVLPCGEEVLKRWESSDKRTDLIEQFKRVGLDKATTMRVETSMISNCHKTCLSLSIMPCFYQIPPAPFCFSEDVPHSLPLPGGTEAQDNSPGAGGVSQEAQDQV